MELLVATVVGGLLTLLGVWLTLRHNQKVHEKNLREERKKRKEEREFLAKQAALLTAAEAVTRFIDYYTTLADRALPSNGTVSQEITEINIALNRLHFFCSLETIEKTTRLGQILSEAVTETMKVKMPSIFLNEELKVIDLQIFTFENMNASLQEEIIALLQSDPHNPLIAHHREQVANNIQAIADCHGKRTELFKLKYIETEKCRDIISRNLKTIYEGSRDVLLLARQELSFPINQEKYKKLIDERIESMERKLKDFYIEIRRQIEEKLKEV